MATFKPVVLKKLPNRQEILPVFSTFVFFVYTWALYRMFFQVPSWLYYLNLWDVGSLAAYVLAFALLESLALTGALVAVALLLPARFFRLHFTAEGSLLAVILSGGALLLQRRISVFEGLQLNQLILYPLLLLVGLAAFTFLLAFLLDRLPQFKRLVMALAERMTVFSILYLPLSILSLLVVLARNIF